MLIKENYFEVTRESLLGTKQQQHCDGTCDFLTKEASAESIAYFNDMEAKPDHVYLLVVAMSSGEKWGPNKNGDYFLKKDLIKYHKIFESAGVFWNHDNKDKSKSSGIVTKSFWNEPMERIELVIEMPMEKARYIPDHIERGIPIRVSMGLTTPCFIKNTRIMLPNGVELPIQDVKVGEEVVTSYGNVKKVLSVSKTEHPFSLTMVESTDGNVLISTHHHKYHVVDFVKAGYIGDANDTSDIEAFLIKEEKTISEIKEWVMALELDKEKHVLTSIGDSISGIHKSTVVNHDEVDIHDGFVYDLVVEDDHSFVAEKINVHNSEHCSICGHVTRGSYANRCEHLKFMMNAVLHNGKKVYAISGTPFKIFDISIISGKQADRTAFSMLTKTASQEDLKGGLSGLQRD